MAEYEDVWAAQRDIIARLISSGERSLPRVLHRSMMEWRAKAGGRGVAFGKPVELPPPAMDMARHAFRMETLYRACEDDTDAIVELGCGCGCNLAGLYLAGGPSGAYYLGLEPTQSGRACVDLLAGLEPELRLRSAPFDFRAPDYAPVGKHRHLLVCTLHSVEQVPQLSGDVIRDLLGLAERVTCVHFEPVGWQMGAQSEIGATEAYSKANGYNENLWPLLKNMEAGGEIEIVRAEPDIIGHKRWNTDSLIVWRKST